MLDLALIGSTALLGLAGMAHCAAMCGGACAALTGPGAGGAGGAAMAGGVAPRGAAAAAGAFQLARLASYAAGGAVAAASVGALAAWSQWTPVLRPFWTLLHVAMLGLGVYLLWRGRQPQWLADIGRRPQPQASGGWQRLSGPGRAAAAGGLWVAWPCGLLQSALLVAAMANTPWGGGLAMAAFAITSSGGLLAAPWAWRRWGRRAQAQALAVRLAGALLAGASAFALLHGLWPAFAAFCSSL